MVARNQVKRLSVFSMLILIGLLLIAMPLPAIWAMSPQSPESQGTVPPRPTPSGGGKEGPGGVPTPTTPPSSYIGAQKKFDSSGGSLDLWLPDGHCLMLQIMPGAFDQQVELDVQTIEPYKSPADTCDQCDDPNISEVLCKATIAYTLKGWQAIGGEIPPTQKVAPYQHVICYTAADLQLADNDPTRFVIASYDEAKKKWVAHPTTLDAANHRVMTTADHLSWWGLMVKTPCVAPQMILDRLPETGGEYVGLPAWLSFVVALMGLILLNAGIVGMYRHFRNLP